MVAQNPVVQNLLKGYLPGEVSANVIEAAWLSKVGFYEKKFMDFSEAPGLLGATESLPTLGTHHESLAQSPLQIENTVTLGPQDYIVRTR